MFHTILGHHDVAVLEFYPSAYVSASIHLHHFFERSRTAFLPGLYFDGEYLRSDLGDEVHLHLLVHFIVEQVDVACCEHLTDGVLADGTFIDR